MGFWSKVFGSGKSSPSSPEVPPGKAWIMGTAPWGGVLLECGPAAMALVILPVSDAAVYRVMPPFPPGMVKVAIVCNGSDHGFLAGRTIARGLGLDVVYATNAARDVDRLPPGTLAPGGVRVEQLARVTVGPLDLIGDGTSVWAQWSNGTTAVIGDAVPVDAVLDRPTQHVLGRLTARREPGAERTLGEAVGAVAAAVTGYVAMDCVPAGEGDAVIAAAFGHAPPLPVASQIIAAILSDELVRADTLAAIAIDRGDDVAEMRFQRAIIAMMRGDDAAAIRELEQSPDDPRAQTSLCQLYARQRDPRARALARRALDALPGDPIAIRGAILAHALTGDAAGARAVLASHGAALSPEHRVAFERSIDDPPMPTRHRFPEHAQLAADAAKPLIEARRFDEAEALLRRAVALDDSLDEHAIELGYVLSQLDRNADAIAVYDAALAGGGSPLLRFNRANCLLRMERFDAAVADYRAAVTAIPSRPDLRVNLVSALFASGKPGAAREELEVLRRSGGVSRVVLSNLESMLGSGTV